MSETSQKKTSTEPMRRPGRRLFALGFLLGLIIGAVVGWGRGASSPGNARESRSAARSAQPAADGGTVESSMSEVLEIAEEALAYLRENLDDYTARMIKQESVDGVPGEVTEKFIKIQCRHRGGDFEETQPMRVYLRFDGPPSAAGREVIWAEDMHDGKLVAHEGGLMGLLTVYLEPTGMVAMRGQRYPIWEIGLTNLLKKLIERGEPDRDDPDVSVTITSDVDFEGRTCDLITVTRRAPSGRDDDFAVAEIFFDRARRLPLRYVAWGWPDSDEAGDGPLLESYSYLDVETNVGLTEADFDPKNPEYSFR